LKKKPQRHAISLSHPLLSPCITRTRLLCRVLTCPFMRLVHELATYSLIPKIFQLYFNHSSWALGSDGPSRSRPRKLFSRFSSSCMGGKTARDAAFNNPGARSETGNKGLACESGMWSMHIDSFCKGQARTSIDFFLGSVRESEGDWLGYELLLWYLKYYGSRQKVLGR
jgi:hypothetical protein